MVCDRLFAGISSGVFSLSRIAPPYDKRGAGVPHARFISARRFRARGAGLATLASSFEFVRHFIRLRWRLIALTTLVGIAVAGAGLAFVPSKYNATATILIDKQRLNFFNDSVVSDLSIDTNAAIEGQVEILKSDVIARRVIERLKLERDVDFALPKPFFGIPDALGIAHSPPPRQARRDAYLMEALAKNRTIRRLGASFAIEVGFQSHSERMRRLRPFCTSRGLPGTKWC
jgi:hypothetical protein